MLSIAVARSCRSLPVLRTCAVAAAAPALLSAFPSPPIPAPASSAASYATTSATAAAAPLAAIAPRRNATTIGLAHQPRRFYAALPPHHKITMPALSPTMTAGNLAKWSKKVGDAIQPGDVLAEIETDKATMELESPEEGVLAAVFVPDNSKDVPVGKLICIIAENKDDVGSFKDVNPETASAAAPAKKADKPAATAAAPAPSTSSPAPAAASAPAASSSAGRILASPLARKLAQESSVDLSSVTASGPNNRIVKSDVEAAKASGAKAVAAPVAAPAPAAAAPAAPARAAPYASFTDVPTSNIRKVIATRLLQAKQTIPHYYLTVDVRMDAVNKLRQELNAHGKGAVKLSVNDFVVKASALALRKVPAVNASWMDTFIRQYNTVDISIAVNTDNGLITPIVANADQKGLAAISDSVKDLATRAKAGKLAPQEFQGGSFTISNLGMYGVSQFAAIINPPQSCILAVGATEMRPVYDGPADAAEPLKHIQVASVMTVTLSCDHRVVDGAVGAQWLQAFKGFLEKPSTMLL